MPDPAPKAIFLSYAREDADAARRIAEALRASGLEVWFDQNELRGGDAWDQKIRRKIKECSLFIPIISAHTQERGEGYFRLEWKLAVERTHLMAEGVPFLLPVSTDDTTESAGLVPAEFMRVQWSRLPGALPTPEFVSQVRQLLSGPRRPATPIGSLAPGATQPVTSGSRSLIWALGAVALLALVAALYLGFRPGAPSPASNPQKPPAPPAAVAPELDKSIAVLPFVDMSQSKDQEYFADGLSEELLNLLAKIPGLHVTSRSSAFAFKGKSVGLSEVARQLNVAHILEGSVRKSGNRLRITAQLIDARTDTHLWSETYDRSLDDIFAVQDDIAAAVVTQLRVTLLGAAPKAKAVNPKAYALLLQARQLQLQRSTESLAEALLLYQQAIAVDPQYTTAWVGLASIYSSQADAGIRANEEGYRLAREAATHALAIDPDCALAHAWLGNIISVTENDPSKAVAHYEKALALEPTNTDIMVGAMNFLRGLDRPQQVIPLGEYVTAHDPVNSTAFAMLGGAYIRSGRYEEGIAALQTSLRLAPGRIQSEYTIGMVLLKNGQLAQALAAVQREPAETWRLDGLAMVYHALGRKAESDAVLAEATRKYEREAAWNIAYIHAFRGETDETFAWLEKALAYHDPGLSLTAVTWQFNSVHSDPRWLPFMRRIGRAPEQLAAIKLEVRLPKN